MAVSRWKIMTHNNEETHFAIGFNEAYREALSLRKADQIINIDYETKYITIDPCRHEETHVRRDRNAIITYCSHCNKRISTQTENWGN